MMKAAGLVLTLACLSAPALAQGAGDPLEACFRETDAATRLACFDAEMQRRHRGATGAAGQDHGPDVAGQDHGHDVAGQDRGRDAPGQDHGHDVAGQDHRDDNVGLDGKQLLKKLKEQGVHPEPARSIVATITRLVQRPDHAYLFELDNGQVWEQMDTAPGLFVKPHEAVTIRPGVLGAFFLKTQARQSIRVHRVR